MWDSSHGFHGGIALAGGSTSETGFVRDRMRKNNTSRKTKFPKKTCRSKLPARMGDAFEAGGNLAGGPLPRRGLMDHERREKIKILAITFVKVRVAPDLLAETSMEVGCAAQAGATASRKWRASNEARLPPNKPAALGEWQAIF
jgi:hypothetical protein